MVIIVVFVIWLAIALGSGKVAASRNRSQFGGFLFGAILGPLGFAIVCLLPKV